MISMRHAILQNAKRDRMATRPEIGQCIVVEVDCGISLSRRISFPALASFAPEREPRRLDAFHLRRRRRQQTHWLMWQLQPPRHLTDLLLQARPPPPPPTPSFGSVACSPWLQRPILLSAPTELSAAHRHFTVLRSQVHNYEPCSGNHCPRLTIWLIMPSVSRRLSIGLTVLNLTEILRCMNSDSQLFHLLLNNSLRQRQRCFFLISWFAVLSKTHKYPIENHSTNSKAFLKLPKESRLYTMPRSV